jgi:phosphoserine phosphatase
MAQKGIKTLFQTEDVFNKKKRVLLFDIALNLMDTSQLAEILQQTDIDASDIQSLFEDESGRIVAEQLEGLPRATYDSVVTATHATPDTMELLQTLKTMGYTVGLITSASTLFAEKLSEKLGIDHFFGIPYEIDDDTQCFSGSIQCDFPGINRQQIIDSIVASEGVAQDDVTIINTGNQPRLPGIHPVFNLGTILDLFNRHTVSARQLCAIIASFGIGL